MSAGAGSRIVYVLVTTLAVLLHLGGGWLVLVSGLVAPLWAIVFLGIVWLGATVVLARLVRDRSRWAVAVPIGFVAFWFAVVNVGEITLGWTA